jgi:hypothetical protein
MDNQKPLKVVYLIEENRVMFGWGPDENRAMTRLIPLCSREAFELSLMGGDVTESQVIASAVQSFFEGPLSVDLKIPADYPYELIKDGETEPLHSGTLRRSKER